MEKEINERLKGDMPRVRKDDYMNNYDYYMTSIFPKEKTFCKMKKIIAIQTISNIEMNTKIIKEIKRRHIFLRVR